MDRDAFDRLAKLLAASPSRRAALGALLAAAAALPAASGAARRGRGAGDKGKRKTRDGGRARRRGKGDDKATRAEAACCASGNCAPGAGNNLARCCYQGQNLTGKNFKGANLGGANFSGAILTGANLQGANLDKACLVAADLRGVRTNSSTNLGGVVFCRTKTDAGENNAGCGKGTPCCPTCGAAASCPAGQVCCGGACVRGACCTAGDCDPKTCQTAACAAGQCAYAPISGTKGPNCNSICCDGACDSTGSVCGGICGNVCTPQETCCGEKCVPTSRLCGGICGNSCQADEICCGEKCTPAKLLCGGNCQNACPETLTCCGQGLCQACCGDDASTCKPAGPCGQVTCEKGACVYAADKDGAPCEGGKGICCAGTCVPAETLCGGTCGNVCAAPTPHCCGQTCQACCTDAHCPRADAPFCLGFECVAETVVRTFERVRTVVATILGVDEEKITMASEFVADLGADSLDVVELIVALEEEFGITIADEDAENIDTVGDAVRYIVARTA